MKSYLKEKKINKIRKPQNLTAVRVIKQDFYYESIVSLAAVFLVVAHGSGALRDIQKNGCELQGDYLFILRLN